MIILFSLDQFSENIEKKSWKKNLLSLSGFSKGKIPWLAGLEIVIFIGKHDVKIA